MKKTLMVLGGIFVVVIVIVVIGIVFSAVKGQALDRESKQYVDAAIPAIAAQWDIRALQERASPEFKTAVNDEDLEKLIRMYQRLGKLQQYQGSKGDANLSLTNQRGKVITAHYITNAEFDTGPATITLDLIKHDDQWQILRMNVNSKVFLESP